MKARVVISLLFAAIGAACGADRAVTSDLGAACARDAQCASGFCDLARCVAPQGDYGRSCEPAPRADDGLRDGKLNRCGAYVCVLDRCRSCTSADQCRDEYGAPACVATDDRPGARCGRP